MNKPSSDRRCQNQTPQGCEESSTSDQLLSNTQEATNDESIIESTAEPQPSTSRFNLASEDPERKLRKRRVDLNRLPSNITCPQVCKFQHCGIQLRDGDQLEWHYQGHIAQEIEKLKKIRVKKPTAHQTLMDDVRSRRRVRNLAFEKIRFHREKRLALARSGSTTASSPTRPRLLECPVCNRVNLSDDEHQDHVTECLRTAPAPPEDPDDFESEVDPESENLDVESINGFETYTWAGQTRIRATSLVEGGLRGAGFLTITRGDEDVELDIENVDDEIAGAPQYTEDDVINVTAPTSDNDTASASNDTSTNDANTSSNATAINDANTSSNATSINDTNTSSNAMLTDDAAPRSSADDSFSKSLVESEVDSASDLSKSDLQTLVAKLTNENEELKRQIVCKICMDPVYNKPLVSLVCWHVHCEECWLRSLGAKKLCPQCKVIIQPKDLRRVYL